MRFCVAGAAPQLIDRGKQSLVRVAYPWIISVLPSHAGSHILSRLSFWSGLKNCCLHLTLTGVCWGKEGNKLNPIAENEVHFGLCSKVDFNQKDGCGNITVSIGLWIPKILLMLLSFSRDIGTPRFVTSHFEASSQPNIFQHLLNILITPWELWVTMSLFRGMFCQTTEELSDGRTAHAQQGRDKRKNPVVTFSCEALPFNKSQLNRNTQRSVCYKLQHSDNTQVIHL